MGEEKLVRTVLSSPSGLAFFSWFLAELSESNLVNVKELAPHALDGLQNFVVSLLSLTLLVGQDIFEHECVLYQFVYEAFIEFLPVFLLLHQIRLYCVEVAHDGVLHVLIVLLYTLLCADKVTLELLQFITEFCLFLP